jgi:serine/threonine protein kinase
MPIPSHVHILLHRYVAPELLKQKPYGKVADWWSFGILLFEMITGRTPFFSRNRSVMFKQIAEKVRAKEGREGGREGGTEGRRDGRREGGKLTFSISFFCCVRTR